MIVKCESLYDSQSILSLIHYRVIITVITEIVSRRVASLQYRIIAFRIAVDCLLNEFTPIIESRVFNAESCSVVKWIYEAIISHGITRGEIKGASRRQSHVQVKEQLLRPWGPRGPGVNGARKRRAEYNNNHFTSDLRGSRNWNFQSRYTEHSSIIIS